MGGLTEVVPVIAEVPGGTYAWTDRLSVLPQ
ncbi:hypothetical protein LMG29542_08171 [Paraburkholderia humisilvae]|uniref:Uncharacterized protein n=1 Tax=Paraburkholderia humisilvae TaxID=627669 RepID=A0A6J5F7L3_9BURK|nr:hypothetical protein LMG29542_08171 [Paraburkholderia humisilvae]